MAVAQRLGGSPVGRVLALLVAAATLAFMVWRVALAIDHAHLLVYQLPVEAVVTVVVAAGIAVLAAWALVVLPRQLVGLAAAMTAALALAGLHVFPPAGLVVGLISGFAIRLRAGSGPLARPVAAGSLLAAGALVAWVVSSQPPVVRCLPGGVTTSDRAWWGGGAPLPCSGLMA